MIIVILAIFHGDVTFMTKFTAQVQYDEAAVKLLCRVVCDTYAKQSPLIIGTLSISLIIGGIWAGLNETTGLLAAAFGCILLPHIQYHRRNFTKQMLAVVQGWWPKMHYVFTDKEVITDSGRETTRTSYESIIRLTRSSEYDYLFVSRTTAFMIDMRKMSQDERDAMEAFLAEKTGLAFKKYPHWGIRLF